MTICVVGRGIIGLSVAEYLSRNRSQDVIVLASERFPPASLAAAANLATKSQVFGRDPHFELKLSGKRQYAQWLSSLCSESGTHSSTDVTHFFRSGPGLDFFDLREQADQQWNRVVQPEDEIIARGLSSQKILRRDDFTIEYADEGWVDAKFLLQLLESVLRSRGVQFKDVDVSQFENVKSVCTSLKALIVCAGSMTPSILSAWGLVEFPKSMQKRRRWSFGGTLEIDLPYWQLPEDGVLLEYVTEMPIGKVTISGTSGRFFCSSVSMTCSEEEASHLPILPEVQVIEQQKEQMLRVLRDRMSLDIESVSHRWRWGWRLGFGHSELVIDRIPQLFSDFRGSLMVVAGAHKSGFLFAPSIGFLVGQKLQG